jgi:uncharacterized protein (TIGR00369 family)
MQDKPAPESHAPDGFHIIELSGGFFDTFGAIYAGLIDGVPTLGFRVEQQHINPMGVCHGGVIASLADMQAFGAQHLAGIEDRFTPTINLTVDYIAPTQPGAWVELRIGLIKATGSLLFSEGILSADGGIVARSNAIFKIPRSAHPDRLGMQPLFR